ncbi:MAG TPA: OmpA family protein [Blastocatellia bacterium]|nr:OmpA family protein [Blastocatellia bacterium]
MTETAAQSSPDKAASNTRAPTNGLDELRGLLLAPEQERLAHLQERLDDPRQYAEDVSRVLPDAILLRPAGDQKLTKALMPSVEEALHTSVRRNPQAVADAIFPVIGPAIRKAIANAFSQMVQSLNQALEHSLSARGLQWRWEALRTGKSFAEVVLSHTLLYRVEQVFLIHKETGLLLQHVTASSVAAPDADLVAGMLTAIQDFARDSFGAPKGEGLDSFQIGELAVWVERGPKAVLAAVIRGSAPMELRQTLQNSLDAIHFEQRHALESFQGDCAPFELCRDHLEKCLQQQLGTVSGEAAKSRKALWIGLAAALVLGLGLWLFFTIRDNWRWNDYLERLNAEPGIVVISAEKRGGKYYLSGLRDPLAADPRAILQATKIAPETVISRWEPYQASHPDFVLARARDLLQPPASVNLTVADGALRAKGVAPGDWITEARRLARALAPVARFDDDNLIDADSVESRMEEVRQRIEEIAIPFAVGSAEIPADQDNAVERLRVAIQELEELSQMVGRSFRIEVIGHADETGSREVNRRLMQERAATVRAVLAAKGLDAARLIAAGEGAAEERRERRRSRKTSFKVILADAAPPGR